MHTSATHFVPITLTARSDIESKVERAQKPATHSATRARNSSQCRLSTDARLRMPIGNALPKQLRVSTQAFLYSTCAHANSAPFQMGFDQRAQRETNRCNRSTNRAWQCPARCRPRSSLYLHVHAVTAPCAQLRRICPRWSERCRSLAPPGPQASPCAPRATAAAALRALAVSLPSR